MPSTTLQALRFTGATGDLSTNNATQYALTAGAVTPGGPALDIDLDGEVQALTDGILIARYLFDFRGETLIAGAIGQGTTRDTAEDIEDYLASLL